MSWQVAGMKRDWTKGIIKSEISLSRHQSPSKAARYWAARFKDRRLRYY